MRTPTASGGMAGWAVRPAIAVLCGGLLLGGCAGAGEDGIAGDEAAREVAGAGRAAVPPAATGTRQEARRTQVQTRAVIRRAEIVLEARDLQVARTEVEHVLGRTGGHLASEVTRNDRAGRPERSVLVLRVPEPAFDDAMAALTDIGRTVRADRSAEDVTTQMLDVDSRVATHQASLSRLQRFLREARTVEDVIRLESEIAERQAHLESLEAQQDYLRDQTALSTITVRMRAATAATAPGDGDDGFAAGVRTGWTALKVVLVGAATLLGALLPFLAVAVLVGVPVWLLVRTLVRRRQVPTAPPPSPGSGTP